MTEIATDDAAPIPQLPRRSGRNSAASGGGRAGPIVLGSLAALLLIAGAVMAWRPLRFSAALDALAAGENAPGREKAVQTLQDMKEYAAPRLQLLASSTAAAQRLKAMRAIRTLAVSGDPSFLDPVSRAATDPKEAPDVRAEAIAALGEAATQSPEALKALLELAEKPDPFSGEAMEALADLSPSNDPCLKPLLDRGFKTLSTSPNTRLKVAYLRAFQGILAASLGGADAPPAPPAFQLLQATLGASVDCDPLVRVEADRLLKLIPPVGAKRTALALEGLASGDPWTRVWSEGVLREATGRTVGYDPFSGEADRRAASERWKDAAKTRP